LASSADVWARAAVVLIFSANYVYPACSPRSFGGIYDDTNRYLRVLYVSGWLLLPSCIILAGGQRLNKRVGGAWTA